MERINAHHRLAIAFVKTTNDSPNLNPNANLLQRIVKAPEFTPELLKEALESPWRMESVYSQDPKQPKREVYDGAAFFDNWSLPGVLPALHDGRIKDSAPASLTILTSPETLQTGESAVMPKLVAIPHGFIGQNVGGHEIIGLGWGTTFSCCGSADAVDFHVVFRDQHGNLQSQARASSLACSGITQAYNKEGLIQTVDTGALHEIQHTVNKIRGLAPHCGHKLEMSEEGMARGAEFIIPINPGLG